MKETLELYKLQRIEFVKLIRAKAMEINKMRTNEKILLNPNANFILERAYDELAGMRKFIHNADRLAIVANTQNNEIQDVITDYEEEIEKWKKVIKIQMVTETIKLTLKSKNI